MCSYGEARLQVAARIIVAIENPQDVIALR